MDYMDNKILHETTVVLRSESLLMLFLQSWYTHTHTHTHTHTYIYIYIYLYLFIYLFIYAYTFALPSINICLQQAKMPFLSCWVTYTHRQHSLTHTTLLFFKFDSENL